MLASTALSWMWWVGFDRHLSEDMARTGIPENTAVGQHMILIEAQEKRDVVWMFTVGK